MKATTEAPHPSKNARRVVWVMYAALLLMAVAVGIFLYWAATPADVLEIKNAPVPVRTIRDHPRAEGVVILRVDYCKKMHTMGRMRVSFVSPSREVFLPAAPERQPANCDVTEIPVLLPKDIPPGMYRVRFRILYDINPIKQDIVEEFDSKEFEVVP